MLEQYKGSGSSLSQGWIIIPQIKKGTFLSGGKIYLEWGWFSQPGIPPTARYSERGGNSYRVNPGILGPGESASAVGEEQRHIPLGPD